MSKFTFMVEVETEKTTGLIASRDEQAEKIIEAIEQAADYADVSGIGARSDSEYSVIDTQVYELEKKDLKEINAEYDSRVAAEAPSDKELRQELKRLREDVATYKSQAETAHSNLKALLESPEFKETSVWLRDDVTRTRRYLPDGRYDNIYWLMTDDGDETISIRKDDDGGLEIRYNGMSRQLVAVPRSGNELQLKLMTRR